MTFLKSFFSKRSNLLLVYTAIVFIASYLTYFKGYDYPPSVFWDENYHIASGQKYVEGVMFMEPHPPLGKLFVALGEKIFQPNSDLDLTDFTKTDYIKDFPAGYSFLGVRFFSALFAWLSGVVFFYILYFISRNPHTSLAFSSLYVFENALITHSRAAMLEGSLLFFILLTVLYFVYLLQKKKVHWSNHLFLGLLSGLPISIKATGGIVFLLFPFLLAYKLSAGKELSEKSPRFSEPRFQRDSARLFFIQFFPRALSLFKNFITKGLIFSAGILIVFFSVWYVHFTLGKTAQEEKYYKASDQYKMIMENGLTGSPKYFFTMLGDNLAYMANYNKGVPKLDVCKPDENGSHPMTWPLGDKSINYRWEKNSEGVRYMYLQGNPIIWLMGLAGVILSLILIIGRLIFKMPIKNRRLFFLIVAFSSLYLAYMAMMLQIERVMYLYHYFIPLLFSFILTFLVFSYIFEERIASKSKVLFASLIAMVIIIALTYNFFSPLSYYQPLTTDQFEKRVWFDFWKLKPVK
ncbi:phospholipid carrier-dependent glycosyltransferase [Candidatus Parcubacteria bacterium]|nr:MAG: phospholipid carrier-dependent glycosyltransferase [Candidatus Parcubacteria bacterium]